MSAVTKKPSKANEPGLIARAAAEIAEAWTPERLGAMRSSAKPVPARFYVEAVDAIAVLKAERERLILAVGKHSLISRIRPFVACSCGEWQGYDLDWPAHVAAILEGRTS